MRLKELRLERALSQEELAGKAGVSHDVIWRLETGKGGSHPSTVRKLAAALGVDPKELRQ